MLGKRNKTGTRVSRTDTPGVPKFTMNPAPKVTFLPTSRALPDGTILVLDVHEPEVVHRGPPVILVTEVAYSKRDPVLGIGIRWKHAICQEGIDRLSLFLADHFSIDLDPIKVAVFKREQGQGHATILYDFQVTTLKPVSPKLIEALGQGEESFDIQYPQNFLPKAGHIVTRLRISKAAAAAPQTAQTGRNEIRPGAGSENQEDEELASMVPLSEAPAPAAPGPDAMEAVAEDSDVGFDEFTQDPSSVVGAPGSDKPDRSSWVEDLQQRLKVKVPVVLFPMLGLETFEGLVRRVTFTHLFALVPPVRVSSGDRLVVRFPLTHGPRSATVVFVVKVVRIIRDRKAQGMGLDLAITSVDEDDTPGIFKGFVSELQRRDNTK